VNNKEAEAMRQTLTPMFLVAIVCAVTVGLAAQAPSSSASQAGKQVTFSGCIEKAPSEGAATSAAGSASPAFILTNAAPASSSASGTTGTAGTAGSASAKPAAKYRLDADEAKISPHVGHKVEVTGTVEEQSSATATSSPSGATASTSTGPKFKVESVKMIAASCS
jgi:hypothetical protein